MRTSLNKILLWMSVNFRDSGLKIGQKVLLFQIEINRLTYVIKYLLFNSYFKWISKFSELFIIKKNKIK